jgi:hypothetical protein
MLHQGSASVVSEYLLSFSAGVPLTFETTNLSSGSDPVLHLLTSAGTQVAVDDNSAGGTRARLSYTASASATYRLVVRAKNSVTSGTCDLRRNGALYLTGVAFGGLPFSLSSLRASEAIETVRLPNGAGETHILYVLKTDGLGMAVRKEGGGTGGAAYYKPSTTLGTRTVIVAVPRLGTTGPVRLLRNDSALSGHDPDADGLGTELEAALGTCSALSGYATGPDAVEFDCSRATDARDTDGDGISDGWEVLGRRNLLPHQPLPKWGADPRHKDLFVEADFMLRMPGEVPQKFQPAHAKKFADYYGDAIGGGSALRKLYRAITLRNPDQLSGIRVHFDTGVPPAVPSDATIYGNWGGYTAVAPVLNADGTYSGANPQSVWTTQMAAARVGIFRYFLPYSSGGGSNPENAFAWAAGIDQSWVATHESGHAQGLGHSGPSGITGYVDVNCKPNYQSLMNYAFQGSPDTVGFSDGLDSPALNNWLAKEYQGVSTANPALMDVLENVFKYWVDRSNGHVDWNRDGVISPAGTTVKAYLNYKPGGGGCEYTRYNANSFDGATSAKGPALARLGGRTYVFYVTPTGVAYRWTSSTLSCAAPGPDPCGTFTGTGSLSMSATGGIDAVRIGAGTTARILLVGISSTGALSQARLSLGISGSEVWTAASTIAGGAAAGSEPSLAALDTCTAHLVYKGTDGKVRTNRTNCGNGWTWEGEQVAMSSTGDIGIATYASPAVVRTYLPWKPGVAGLYGAFPAATDGRVDLWWWNNGTGLWEKTDVLESRPGPVEAKPAMAWVPHSTSAEFPGRFYLMTVAHNTVTPAESVVRWMFSYVKVTKNPDGTVASMTEKVGLAGPFDNVWATAEGIDLLYENGVDINLRAALTLGEGTGAPYLVTFRPKADGIQDFQYVNYNDWQVLRVGLCQQVANPGGLVTNPIQCPVKDW